MIVFCQRLPMLIAPKPVDFRCGQQAVVAAKAGQDNADLLFNAMNLSGRAADVFDGLLGLGFRCHGFLAHLRSMKATMSQKASVPQYT